MEEIASDGTRWDPRGFFPTNPDLAGILGRTDLNFENFYVFDFLDPKFLDFQVPRFPKSGPGRAGLGPWARLGPYLVIVFCRIGIKVVTKVLSSQLLVIVVFRKMMMEYGCAMGTSSNLNRSGCATSRIPNKSQHVCESCHGLLNMDMQMVWRPLQRSM